jgi:hypothetical protein
MRCVRGSRGSRGRARKRREGEDLEGGSGVNGNYGTEAAARDDGMNERHHGRDRGLVRMNDGAYVELPHSRDVEG